MSSFAVEERGALLLMTVSREPTTAEFEQTLRVFEARLARRERCVFIFDAVRVSNLPAELRQRQGEWLREHDAAIRAWVLGVAFVFSSAIPRFVLSSIFLVKPLPIPYTVCATQAEAIAWADQTMRLAGLSPDPSSAGASIARPSPSTPPPTTTRRRPR